MNLKDRVFGFVVCTLLFASSFYLSHALIINHFLNDFESKEFSVGIEYKAIEDDIFQLYYKDSLSKLTEKHSQKIPISASDEYQWLKFRIPDSVALSKIRFDFGNENKTSSVELKKFLLKYNGHVINLAEDSLETFFKVNKYAEKTSKKTYARKVIGKRSDPFMVSVNLAPIVKNLRAKPNIKREILGTLLSVILSFAVLSFFLKIQKKQKTILKSDHVFVGMFLCFTILPFFDSILSLDNTMLKEKRELTLKPIISKENIQEYPHEFENYFNDNFGFRNRLISIGGELKTKLFNTSPREENVILGKEDWLFYWKPDIRASYLNQHPFSEEELQRFEKMLNQINQWSNENGKSFFVTLYPNKHSVYENKLPKRIRNLKKDTVDRTDMAEKMFSKNDIAYINLFDTLKLHGKKERLYYLNDSHWNAMGAFLAYEQILKRLTLEDTELGGPLKHSDFKVKRLDNHTHGDLIDIMGIDYESKQFTDQAIFLVPKKRPKLHIEQNFMGKGITHIRNTSKKNKKIFLLVGDSYNLELVKILRHSFNETYFVRSTKLNIKVIEKINPDFIVYGIVERNLENL